MNSAASKPPTASAMALAALVVALPLMKPAVTGPVLLPDLLFLVLAAAIAFDWARRRLVVSRDPAFLALAAYVAALAPSMLASDSPGQSAFKLATTGYLAALAAATFIAARDPAALRSAVLAWLGVTAALVVLALASVAAFAVAPGNPLYAYASFHLGTLPPGHYPRLALTFLNANMACNYLTVSLGLLFVAWREAWLSPGKCKLLCAGIIFAAATTLSPGLGGIALVLGTGACLLKGKRIALLAGAAVASAALVAAAFTPILHSTAPFFFIVPGTDIVLAPSGRYLVWSAALDTFIRHPLIGQGIGVDPLTVQYLDPSGWMQTLTDAHNVILNIAAQAGLIGLAGLALLIAFAVRLGRANRIALALSLTFLNAFLYQGLTGSFEDTRHLWVLLGLLIAAAHPQLSRAGGNNRRAGAPSPC